jgi:hypothetical protein
MRRWRRWHSHSNMRRTVQPSCSEWLQKRCAYCAVASPGCACHACARVGMCWCMSTWREQAPRALHVHQCFREPQRDTRTTLAVPLDSTVRGNRSTWTRTRHAKDDVQHSKCMVVLKNLWPWLMAPFARMACVRLTGHLLNAMQGPCAYSE